MADTAAAQAQAPAPTSAAEAISGGVNRGAQRADRRAAAVERMQRERGTVAVAPAAAPAPAQAAPPAAAAAPPVKPPDGPADKSAAAPPDKPEKPEKPDPATERGLRVIEQERKKLLDEKNSWKTERELQLAELAQLRKQAEGKLTSDKDLKGLKPKDLIAQFSHYTNEDWHALSRLSYAITTEGKADPRAAQAAQDAERALGSRATADKVAELEAKYEKQLAELKEQFATEFTRRDQASFASQWLDEATKAIPSDKPTFISKVHANEPEKARRELLAIGQELEKANDGIAPSHAEVIAEYESRKRAELKAIGLDPDALLAPPKPAAPTAPTAPAPAAPVTRTLNPAAPTITRPENAPKTRDERRDAAIANLRARQRATADQRP